MSSHAPEEHSSKPRLGSRLHHSRRPECEAAIELMDQVLETVPGPLALLDAQLRFLFANQAYCNLFRTTRPQIVQKPFFAVHASGWTNGVLEGHLHKVMREQGSIDDLQVQHRFHGSLRTYLVRARSLLRPGQPPSVLIGFHDVTRQMEVAQREKFLTDAERAARMEAEHANRTKDNFLAALSHELRNPLNSILGWARLLKDAARFDPARWKEGLCSIESAARTQTRMISDLLDISRINAGKIRLTMGKLDLTQVVESAVQQFVPAAQEKGIRIIQQYEAVPQKLVGDSERLQQVASNLIGNAVKFTPEGGTLSIEVFQEDSWICLRVSDTGPGIPQEFLKHLFRPFRQAEGSTSRRFIGGLGLGLAIVKHLVLLHGGTVKAENRPGAGARFVVKLPASLVANPDGDAQILPLQSSVMADGPDVSGLRVLIVDDDPDACAIARRIFEDHGTRVYIALSAREGLNILIHERPDIIVSDIGMPDQDGYELMRQIRKLPPEQGGRIPAIALTAFARPEDRREALAVGYQRHLAKPVDPVQLLSLIAALTSKQN